MEDVTEKDKEEFDATKAVRNAEEFIENLNEVVKEAKGHLPLSLIIGLLDIMKWKLHRGADKEVMMEKLPEELKQKLGGKAG